MHNDAPAILLPAAQVRVTNLNGANVVLTDVAGANIAKVEIAGAKMVVGIEKDVTTRTNRRGDYNLYFSTGSDLQNITLEVTLAGYQPETKTELISTGQRKIIDFQLTKA
jgi:hypothetical protein